MQESEGLIDAAITGDFLKIKSYVDKGELLHEDLDEVFENVKDEWKQFNLFKARSSPEYLTAVFIRTDDFYKNDPVKKVLEAAFKARKYSSTKPNHSKEYSTLAAEREEWVVKLLELCSTQTEVITFLQTQLPPCSSIEANFGLAILDGHKKLVATQCYQQVVRQKWSRPTTRASNQDLDERRKRSTGMK